MSTPFKINQKAYIISTAITIARDSLNQYPVLNEYYKQNNGYEMFRYFIGIDLKNSHILKEKILIQPTWILNILEDTNGKQKDIRIHLDNNFPFLTENKTTITLQQIWGIVDVASVYSPMISSDFIYHSRLDAELVISRYELGTDVNPFIELNKEKINSTENNTGLLDLDYINHIEIC